MQTTIQWPRFLIVSVVGSVIMLVLYMLWQMTPFVAATMSPGYPARPPEEVKPLTPFLFAVSLTQLVVFCYLYLRVYPQRSLASAVWFGAWAGFFMVLPDGQFFVGTPNMLWPQLWMSWGEGVVTAMLLMAFFQLVYRPRDESWTQPKLAWPRFLVFGALSAVLVFVLDLPFHMFVAPHLFAEYPALDFPQRPQEESAKLLWFLFLTYLFQLSFFCYMFLRVYPKRGFGKAIWFGLWLGLWVVIPNMQFFVGLDKYTWSMLAIQIPEGAILAMIMMAFFEAAYRPKPHSATLAHAE